MPHGPHLNSQQRFIRTVVLSVLSLAKPIGDSATWFLTGAAAISGLLIANSESVTKLIAVGSFKWGLVCLVFSMLAGVIARGMSINISTRISTLNELNEYFNSVDAQKDMAGMAEMNIEPKDLVEQMQSCFSWPLNWAFRRGASKGEDFLYSEKSCARLLSKLIIVLIVQQSLALIGLLVILLGL